MNDVLKTLAFTRIHRCAPAVSIIFADVPIDDLFSIAQPMTKMVCDLDPIPESLLTTNLDLLMLVITGIVNLSLKSGSVSAKLKEAVIKPLLKKPNLDQTEFKNNRPSPI